MDVVDYRGPDDKDDHRHRRVSANSWEASETALP